jgi:hypothetical protein
MVLEQKSLLNTKKNDKLFNFLGKGSLKQLKNDKKLEELSDKEIIEELGKDKYNQTLKNIKQFRSQIMLQSGAKSSGKQQIVMVAGTAKTMMIFKKNIIMVFALEPVKHQGEKFLLDIRMIWTKKPKEDEYSFYGGDADFIATR